MQPTDACANRNATSDIVADCKAASDGIVIRNTFGIAIRYTPAHVH